MQTACFLVALLWRAVGQTGAGGGKGKKYFKSYNTFKELFHMVKT